MRAIASARAWAGVLVLAEDIPTGKAMKELGTLAQAGDPGDLDRQIFFLA